MLPSLIVNNYFIEEKEPLLYFLTYLILIDIFFGYVYSFIYKYRSMDTQDYLSIKTPWMKVLICILNYSFIIVCKLIFPWFRYSKIYENGCRCSCLLRYIHYLSIPLYTNSWDVIPLCVYSLISYRW